MFKMKLEEHICKIVGVFVDLNWHGWMTPLNEFFGSATVLTYVYFDRTEWNLQDFGL